MKKEIECAARFLTNLATLEYGTSAIRLGRLKARLENIMEDYFVDHWFPESPMKGSGYRCIRINHKLDPIVALAGRLAGIADEWLMSTMPSELTVWVDPGEVSYRIGENGSICDLMQDCPRDWRCPSPPRRRRTTSDESSSSSLSSSPASCYSIDSVISAMSTSSDTSSSNNGSSPSDSDDSGN